AVRPRHGQHRGALARLLAVEVDAREVAGEVVIVVLRVLFQRMVVAPGAADADAEERLRDGADDFGPGALALFTHIDDVISDGRVVGGRPLRGQHGAGDLVPRAVGGDLLAQPLVEGTDALDAAHVVVALLAV